MTGYVARAVPWTRVALAAGLVVRAHGARPLEPVGPLAARGDGGRPAGGRDGLVLRRDVRRRRRHLASRSRLAHDGARSRSAAARRDLDGGCAPRGRETMFEHARRDLGPGGCGDPRRCGVHQLATFVRGGVAGAEVRHGGRAGDHGVGAAASARPSPARLPLRHHHARTGGTSSATGWVALAIAALVVLGVVLADARWWRLHSGLSGLETSPRARVSSRMVRGSSRRSPKTSRSWPMR